MATSKVKQVEFKNEWTGKNGTFYYHNIEFENGDIGSIGTKTKNPDKIQVGCELDYRIEKDQKGNNKIVVNQPQQSGGGFQKKDPEAEALKQRMIIAQSSLGYAVEYSKSQQPFSQEGIFELAGKMYEWVINKSKQ